MTDASSQSPPASPGNSPRRARREGQHQSLNRSPKSMQERIMAHPRILALVLGLIAATGYPPLGLWPLTLLGIAGLIALLRRAEARKQAALIGYLFGWAHLTLANNWIATAFTFQGKMPSLLGWLAVPLLCLYLAVYPALAALITHEIAQRLGGRLGARKSASALAYVILFASLWIVTEWLRSWVFTGYPWPPLGLALLGGWEAPGIAKLLPWMGTYALSGIAVLIAGAALWTLEKRQWLLGAALAVAVTVQMFVPGNFGAQAGQAGQEGTVRFTLVQPNIPQEERDAAHKFEEHFARLAKHSYDEDNPKRIIFWPESAVPDYLRDGYPQRYYSQRTIAADPGFARQRIGTTIGSNGKLMFGAVDLEIGEKMGRETAVGAYNAVTTIDGEGNLGARYSKSHLVPYGEYLALRWLLEPLGATRLVAGSIDFIPGPGPQTFDLGDYGKAGVQICYEIVFSGQVVDRSNRPDYIFNPSNDGWFGSWGPPQHLGQSRMRALEEGLPVLRSTTDGISAVVDASGIVRQHIPSGADGGISGFIPPAKAPTWFAQIGNALPLIWAALLFVISIVVLRRRAR
ncbi:MAG: apolipoprotein N-acyltransferase [Marinomonas sp.]